MNYEYEHLITDFLQYMGVNELEELKKMPEELLYAKAKIYGSQHEKEFIKCLKELKENN